MQYFFKTLFLFFMLSSNGSSVWAQTLPDMFHISDDGHRLIAGGIASEGLYDETQIHRIDLYFEESNWWSIMEGNYTTGTDLGATMQFDQEDLSAKVGVRFKGATSYFANNSEKKSFNISLNFEDDQQDVMGHQTLNLNGGYLDESYMREILYLHLSRKHNPSLEAAYVDLYINGDYWGPYLNVQQLDGDYIRNWYPSNAGSRWRAIDPDFVGGGGGGPGGGGPGGGGPGGGGGGMFGTGTSTLNYLGTDTTDYASAYTLKNTSKENPWEDLIHATDILNNTPLANLEEEVKEVLDIDRTLWLLAHEIIFSDDDSYIFKGGMDYYVYWDPESNRITPIEYDGNTVMQSQNADWSPFYNEDDTRFPLLNRLLQIPSIRQRYIAHVRTLLDETFNSETVDPLIDAYFDFIKDKVENDPKAIYSYNQFVSAKDELKDFVANRHAFYWNNAAINALNLEMSGAKWSVNGIDWAAPQPNEAVQVQIEIAGNTIDDVHLWYSDGIHGHFQSSLMYDDGAHADGEANDGIFGGTIPGFGNGTYVRFYIEGITSEARMYHPRGAEHDVYFYRVNVEELSDAAIVINELMASNDATVADEAGEYDDWIELYNNSDVAVDLSNWFLTDTDAELTKWAFPEGTTIAANNYLTIWADDDTEQAPLHTNFKLSASGESVWLIDNDLRIVDEVTFGEQVTDGAYARFPNGTGDFIIKSPTYGFNNELEVSVTDSFSPSLLKVYPNPVETTLFVKTNTLQALDFQIYNSLGQMIYHNVLKESLYLNIADWDSGVYWLKADAETIKFVKM